MSASKTIAAYRPKRRSKRLKRKEKSAKSGLQADSNLSRSLRSLQAPDQSAPKIGRGGSGLGSRGSGMGGGGINRYGRKGLSKRAVGLGKTRKKRVRKGSGSRRKSKRVMSLEEASVNLSARSARLDTAKTKASAASRSSRFSPPPPSRNRVSAAATDRMQARHEALGAKKKTVESPSHNQSLRKAQQAFKAAAYRQVIREYQRYLAVNQKTRMSARIAYEMAVSYEALGRIERAKRYYLEVLKTQSEFQQMARTKLARLTSKNTRNIAIKPSRRTLKKTRRASKIRKGSRIDLLEAEEAPTTP